MEGLSQEDLKFILVGVAAIWLCTDSPRTWLRTTVKGAALTMSFRIAM